MRVIRLAPATLLATTALALAAPAAVADEVTGGGITSFGFSVSPTTVAPGGTVTLKSDSCEVPSVTVSSGVFDTVTLDEGSAGTATVDIEAEVGAEYQVTFDCQGEKGTAPLTIADTSAGGPTGVDAAGDPFTAGHETAARPTGVDETGDPFTAGHETAARPTGVADTGLHLGVKAGFGGGAGELGTTEVVAGTALIAGALGGAGVLLLRRRRTDGPA
ncbi:hypothetical protein AB0D99_02240 [Streptomyces sp. NPDC047971]|uniref:hypothetical protein n=1 Tax=Streptomyces sp. NPDC047971 TaxID=3154499 RepID=UPI0033F3C314